jgi:hypothetical protein
MRILAIAVILLPSLADAQAQKLTAPADVGAKVDKVFAKYATSTTPGCAVGTSIAGDVSLQAAYGMADLEHNVPITPQTIFEPRSQTVGQLKVFVGEYTSDEAYVTYRTALEDGRLLHRRADPPIPLTATYEDGFSSSLGSIRFLRDANGRVIEMSIGRARVWDLRLRKLM